MRLRIVSNLHSFIPAHMLNQWCERAFGIFPLKLHVDHEIKWAGRTAAHSDAVKLLPMRRALGTRRELPPSALPGFLIRGALTKKAYILLIN